MAVGKEIRTKIGSIKSTQKITSAMEMVAASKMRKAQDRMAVGRPYAERIRDVVSHAATANPEYRHVFLQEREVKRVGYIVVSTDRGLCGGLNINLLKRVMLEMRDWKSKGVEIEICAIGQKAVNFFRNYGGNVVAALSHLGDQPSASKLIGSVKVMLDAFEAGRIDQLYLVHNRFINTMTQKPDTIQLLPLEPTQDEAIAKRQWDYLYEPDAQPLLDALLTRFIESVV